MPVMSAASMLTVFVAPVAVTVTLARVTPPAATPVPVASFALTSSMKSWLSWSGT
jgi:hypothetical protein